MHINNLYTAVWQANAQFDVTVALGSGITTYLFPLTRVPFTDLYLHVSGNSIVRPGISTTQTILYKNYGNLPIASGTISYVPNENLNITATSQTVVYSSTGFDFSFYNLQPNETRTLIVTLQPPAIPVINLGDQLVSMAVGSVNSPNEPVLSNNQSLLSQTVINSYDPNDISENHGPKIVHAEFTADDFLNLYDSF